MASELKVKIIVDSKGVVKGFRGADGQVKKFTGSLDKAERSMSRFGDTAKLALTAISVAAIVGITRALANLARKGFQVLNESVQAAGIQQIAERKLEQALANVGDTSEESATQLKELAKELQGVSNFGDEAILTAQAMLLSFKEVSGAEGAALLSSRLLDTAAGISRVSGAQVDLNSVSAAFGRALTQGAGALTEFNVSLSDAEKVAFNAAKGIERVNILTQILDSNFKGLAEATTDPFVQLQNSVTNLKEELGSELRPELEALAIQFRQFVEDEGTISAVKRLGEFFIDTAESIIEFFQFRIPIASKRFVAAINSASAAGIEALGGMVAAIVSPFDAVSGKELINPFQSTIDSLRQIATEADNAKEALLKAEFDQFVERATRPRGGAAQAGAAAGGGAGVGAPGRSGVEIINTTDKVIEGVLQLGQALEVHLLTSVNAVDDALSILDQTLLKVGTDEQRAQIQGEIAALEELRATMLGVQTASEQLAEADKKRADAAVQANIQTVLSSQNALQALIGIAKQEIAISLGKLIAKNLEFLGPAALIAGPAVAAGLVALFSKLIPSFGGGGGGGGRSGGVGRAGVSPSAGSRSVGRDLSQGVRPFTPNAPVRATDVSIEGVLTGEGETLRAVIRTTDKRIGRTREAF